MSTGTARRLIEQLAADAGGCRLSDHSITDALTARDDLRDLRDDFVFPMGPDGATPQAYLCGHGLGVLHKGIQPAMARYFEQWGTLARGAWVAGEDNWWMLDDAVRPPMAEIVGAKPSEVVMMNGLTINLQLLMLQFFKPSGTRKRILCEQFPFPSDMHAMRSQMELHGLTMDDILYVGNPDDARPITTDQILDAIEANKDTIALILLPACNFGTGQFLNEVEPIVTLAHANGIIVGLDCAHAVGNVPLKLHDWNVDFAVWCTYKYLNCGPGNVGGAFIHARHCEGADTLTPALRGWWSRQRPLRFNLDKEYIGEPDASRWQVTSTNVMGIVSIIPPIKACAAVGMEKLRARSVLLTGYMEVLIQEELSHAVEIVTPADEAQRGATLAIRLRPGAVPQCDKADARDFVMMELLGRGVNIDTTPPMNMRISPGPMWSSFDDVHRCFIALKDVLAPAPPAAVAAFVAP